MATRLPAFIKNCRVKKKFLNSLLKEMAPLMGEVQQAQAMYRLRQLVSASLQRGIGLASSMQGLQWQI